MTAPSEPNGVIAPWWLQVYGTRCASHALTISGNSTYLTQREFTTLQNVKPSISAWKAQQKWDCTTGTKDTYVGYTNTNVPQECTQQILGHAAKWAQCRGIEARVDQAMCDLYNAETLCLRQQLYLHQKRPREN